MATNKSTMELWLQLKSDVQGVQNAKREVAELQTSLVGMAKSGAAAFVGFAGAEAAIHGVANMLRAAVVEGVNFNKEMEQMRVSFAAMIRNFDAGKYQNFNDALRQSDVVLGKLRQSANVLGVSFQDMAEGYKTTVGVMVAAGITDIEKQIKLTTMLQGAMRGLGINGFQATRDIQDILTGFSSRTKAGRELMIDDEEVKGARSKGQLYEYLSEKLKGFSEANLEAANTTQALETRLKNNFQQTAADQTKDLTAAYRDLLRSLNELVASDGFKETMKFLGAMATTAVGWVTPSTSDGSAASYKKKIQRRQEEHDAWLQMQGDVSDDASYNKASSFAKRALSELRVSRFRRVQSGEFKNGYTQDDMGDAAKQEDQLIQMYEREIPALERVKQKRIEAAQAAKAAEESRGADRVRLEGERELSSELAKQKESLHGQVMEQRYANASEGERLRILKEMEKEARMRFATEYGAAVDAGNPQAQQAALLRLTLTSLDIEKKRTAEKKSQAEWQQKLDAAFQNQALTDIENNAKDRIGAKEIERAELKNRYDLTDREIRRENLRILKEEGAEYDKILANLQAQLELSGDPKERNQIQSRMDYWRGRRTENGRAQAGARADISDNTEANFTASLTRFQNSLGTTAENVSSMFSKPFEGAFSGLEQGLDNLILKGGKWRDVWVTVANSVATEFIKAGVHMFTSYLAAQAAASVKSLLLHTTTETSKTAVTTAQSALRIGKVMVEAVWDVIKAGVGALSAMASIPYVGPILGVAAMAAVVAAGFGLVKSGKGFADGGYTGGNGKNTPAGIVHEGEYVVPQWMVQDKKYAGLISMMERDRKAGSSGEGAEGEYSFGGFVNMLNPMALFGIKTKVGPWWARPENFFGVDEKNPFFTKTGSKWLGMQGYSDSYTYSGGQWAKTAASDLTNQTSIHTSDTGMSTTSTTSGGATVNIAYFNSRQDASDWLRSRDGERHMVDFLNRQGVKFA